MLAPTCSAADGCLTGKAGCVFVRVFGLDQFPKTLTTQKGRPTPGRSFAFLSRFRSFRLQPASITTSAFGSCEEPYLVDPVDWAAPDCRRATASQRVAFNLQPLHRQGWVGVEASGVRKQGRLID